MGKSRDESKLHDGLQDGLEPLTPLDLSKVNSFSDLLEGYKRTAFGARTLGEAADVLHEMVADKDCFVVMTLSGAMTVAKMGLVVCEMIDRGMVNAVVSTGALMAHGLVEAEGMSHFKYHPGMNDTELYYKGYDRVYDTLELEKNLDGVEKTVDDLLMTLPRDKPVSSQAILRALGKHLHEKKPKHRGILMSAYKKDVPIYVPAFTDSEMGLDVALFNRRMKMKGEEGLTFDPMQDLDHYTELLLKRKKLGIFTIGGGVPRNWAQQFGPYVDIISKRLKVEMPFLRFHYAIRICPEPVHWGGLSGCTYTEGVSWGKFVPKEEGGRFAEVMSDATLAWPLLVKAVIERLER